MISTMRGRGKAATNHFKTEWARLKGEAKIKKIKSLYNPRKTYIKTSNVKNKLHS